VATIFDFDNTLFIVPPRQTSCASSTSATTRPDDAKGIAYYLGKRRRRRPTTHRSAASITSSGAPDEAIDDADLMGRACRRRGFRSLARARRDAAQISRSRRRGAVGLEGRPDEKWSGRSDANRRVGDRSPRARLRASSSPLPDPPALRPRSPTQRFGDFSKVHFWKHRLVKLPDRGRRPPARQLRRLATRSARIDDRRRSPADHDSGWQPDDSQLALSTKFVPLVGGLLQRRDTALAESQYVIGDTIALPTPPASTTAPAHRLDRHDAGQSPDRPRHRRQPPLMDPTSPASIVFKQAGHDPIPLAVNVAPDESRTEPLAAADLEQFGARVGTAAAATAQLPANRQRQLQLFELENRQKMLALAVAGVLGLVIVETALAGRLTRRGSVPSSPSSPRSENPVDARAGGNMNEHGAS